MAQLDDPLQAAISSIQAEQDPLFKPRETLGPVEGAVKSYLWGLGPRMMGIEPSGPLATYEQENPAKALAAEMAGIVTPFIGWAKILTAPKVASRVEKLTKAIEGTTSNPFLRGAATEIAKYSPLEAGYWATGMLAGEELADAAGGRFVGRGELTEQTLTNIGLTGGIGGLFGLVGAAGQRAPKKGETAPRTGEEKAATLQERLAAVEKRMKENPDDASLIASANKLRRDIRTEVPRRKKFVYDLEGFTGYGRDAGRKQKPGEAINRLMKPKVGPTLERKILGVGSKETYLDSVDELKQVMSEAGIVNKEAYMESPRLLRAKSKTGEKVVKSALQGNLAKVDDTWRMARDRGDNLYLMAKQLPDKDEWVLFKTQHPGQFMPSYQNYTEKMMGRVGLYGKSNQQPLPESAGVVDTYNAIVKGADEIPAIELRGADIRKGGTAKVAEEIVKRTGMGQFFKNNGEAWESLKTFVNRYMTPAMFESRGNRLYLKVHAAAKMGLDAAEATAERLFLGGRSLGSAQNIWQAIRSGAQVHPEKGSIKNLIDELYKDPTEAVKFQEAVLGGLSPQKAAQELELGEAGVALMRKLDEVDTLQTKGIQAVQSALGEDMFVPRKRHYMLSRTWEGSHRVEVVDNAGKVLGYAGGKTRAGAMQKAEKIVEAAKADDKNWKVGRALTSGSFDEDISLLANTTQRRSREFNRMARMAVGTPKTMTKRRTGKIGYIGYGDDQWNKRDVEDMVYGQLRNYQRYIAQKTIQAKLDREFQVLQLEDPQLAKTLAGRLDLMFGRQSELSKAQNTIMDTVLSPVLGKNSASKIASTINEWTFRWTLGFMNVGYNMANMLTFAQTAIPQMMYLTSTPSAAASKYWIHLPLIGKETRGLGGSLDVFKVVRQSFKEMGNPDPVLWKNFTRAAEDGVWDPKFLEEWVGQKALTKQRLGDILTQPDSFVETIKFFGDAMPNMSEKFARAQSFSMGHVFFRDIMGVTDPDHLYKLTKEFVEKTQYLYSVGDRPAMFTGPMGQMFGLFKNWMMHNISWWMVYAGEGFSKGNWKPLLWSTASTVPFAGVAGIPIYSMVDSAHEAMTDETIMQRLYEGFYDYGAEPSPVADAAFFGLPAFFGFSLQNQMQAPFANIGDDASFLSNFVFLDRAKHAGKFGGQFIDNMLATGGHPGDDERTQQLFMRAFAPKMFYRASESLKGKMLESSASGYPEMEMSAYERAAYAMGLNPTTLARDREIRQHLWEDHSAMKAQVSMYGRALADAEKQGDWAEYDNIYMRAVYEGVPIDSVTKSARAYRDKMETPALERMAKEEELAATIPIRGY